MRLYPLQQAKARHMFVFKTHMGPLSCYVMLCYFMCEDKGRGRLLYSYKTAKICSNSEITLTMELSELHPPTYFECFINKIYHIY